MPAESVVWLKSAVEQYCQHKPTSLKLVLHPFYEVCMLNTTSMQWHCYFQHNTTSHLWEGKKVIQWSSKWSFT